MRCAGSNGSRTDSSNLIAVGYDQEGDHHLAEEVEVKMWYDKEGDYLEVLFDRRAGFFRETNNDAVMEKVDTDSNVVGFSILKVSSLSGEVPLEGSEQLAAGSF